MSEFSNLKVDSTISKVMSIGKKGIIFFTSIFAILIIMGGIVFTVDQGETVIVLRGGKVVSTSNSGYNFKLPFVDHTETVSNRTQTYKIPKIPVYSKDQQPALLDVSITLSVPKEKVVELYSDYGTVSNVITTIITPNISTIKDVFGKFNATTAIQERDRLGIEVSEVFKKLLYEKTNTVIIESIQLENIDFSKAYEQAIEERMKVEVEVKKYEQQLAKEKIQSSITITKAKAEADSKIAAAEAESKNILLIAEANAKSKILAGEAEAKSISAQTKALNEGGKNLVDYVIANKYKGDVPQWSTNNSNFIPFVQPQSK